MKRKRLITKFKKGDKVIIAPAKGMIHAKISDMVISKDSVTITFEITQVIPTPSLN